MKVKPALAVRWVYKWYSEELERSHKDKKPARLAENFPHSLDPDLALDRCEERLKEAGLLGFESLHCDFHSGLWCN